MASTRFGGPILRSAQGSDFWLDLPQAYPLDYVVVWDDFVMVANDQTNDWTVVKDSGATVAYVADTAGGELALTSAATTNDDGASIQGNEIFLPASGRTMWFETRIKCTDADQTDICAGFTVNFATNPEAMLTAADRICFQVDDGNASILCKTESGGTETSTDSGVDLADNAYVRLGIRVNGTGLVQFFVNRELVATHTTNIPATEMTVGLMSLSGDNVGTRATTADYVFAAATR